jgi:hypothetical protein
MEPTGLQSNRPSDLVRRVLAHPAGPTALAIVLALVSLPIVAQSLDVIHLPQSGGFVPDRLSPTDPARWTAAAGAVLISALIAGTIGGGVVRRSAVGGAILTIAIAWVVAVETVALGPALLNQNVGIEVLCIDACAPSLKSNEPSNWLVAGLAAPFAPLVAFGSFEILCVGVGIWTAILRRFRPAADGGMGA